MAKHDQRILKFLTQNADRAPTITDMMTRLNISISDITASLNSLLAQGMISKRTNGQGIECWFPTNGSSGSAQMGGEYAQDSRLGADSRFISSLNNPGPPEASPLPPLQPTLSASLTGSSVFPNPGATASANASLMGGSKASAMESAVFKASPAIGAMESSAPSPAMDGPLGNPPPPPTYSLAQPARSGIGFMTFLLGLVVAGGGSVLVSGRLMKMELQKASRNFVESKAMDAAVNSWTDFENTTKSHVKALEAEVASLTAQMAAMKSANDSLQALAVKNPEAPKKTVAEAVKKSPRRRR